MNIFYITPLWTGLSSFFFEGVDGKSGMPAFYNVFHSILKDEKFEKVFVFLFVKGKKKEINIPKKYQNKLHVFPYFYETNLSLIMGILNLIFSSFTKLQGKKSCIFAHGFLGSVGSILGFLRGHAVVRRIYGSFLINEIMSKKTDIFQKHPLEYLSFSLPASSTIITNDGTYGDKVYEKIGHKPSKLVFLMNGVSKNPSISFPHHIKIDPSVPFISYIARFDTWKRQHLVLEALQDPILAVHKIPCYLIGQNINDSYFRYLKKIVEDNGLEHIKLIPGLPSSEALWFLKNSQFTLSLYETSNLGNVLLESLAMGTPIITLKNESLNSISKDVYYPLETLDKKETARAILKLWTSPSLRKQLSTKGIDYSNNHLLSWEERIKIEKDILLTALSPGQKLN